MAKQIINVNPLISFNADNTISVSYPILRGTRPSDMEIVVNPVEVTKENIEEMRKEALEAKKLNEE